MQRALRALGRRLIAAVNVGSSDRFTPDFSDRAFRGSLAEDLGWGAAASRGGATESTSRGAEAESHVTRHFRLRSWPRPLIRPTEAAVLARELERDVPHWRAAVVSLAWEFRREGVSIYSIRGPKLDGAEGWRAIAPGPGEDMLYPIRPHRFGFLPSLVLAAAFGECTMRDLTRVLEAWMEFARTEGHALAYVSTLVVAQRFIAMSLGWGLIGALEPSDERTRCEYLLLKIMAVDGAFLVPRVGNSVANNHLLVDGFIGWYVCALLPELAVGRGRGSGFEQLFLRELKRQVLPDGTGFEHSAHYHEMCCELACAYLVWCRNNGAQPPAWLSERVPRMLEFQMALVHGRGEPWAIGDATEDPMLPIDPGGWASGAMRELYRGLFDPSAERARAEDISVMRAYWLLGGLAAGENRRADTQAMRVFGDGGFASFHGSQTDIQVLFRTGPARPHPVCAGHMHADFLAIYVAVAGEPFVVDSGTYSYRRKIASSAPHSFDWRAYLMGPAAHNGACIDGADPLGPVRGDFRALHCEPRAEITRSIATGTLCAVEAVIVSESAYGGIGRGVLHVDGEYIVVYDRLGPGAEAGSCSFGFQFDPRVEVTADGLVCRARGVDRELWLHACEDLYVQDVARGRMEPPGGWVASQYGRLEPAAQIRYRMRADAQLTALLLRVEAAVNPLSIQSRAEGDALFFRVATPQYTDYLVLPGASGEAEAPEWDLRFRGEALWLRDGRDETTRIRWAGGSWAEYRGWRVESRGDERVAELETTHMMATDVPGPIPGTSAVLRAVPAGGVVGAPANARPGESDRR